MSKQLSPRARLRVAGEPTPAHALSEPDSRVYVGDCREILPRLGAVQSGELDLIFADPPFNWGRDYDRHGGRSAGEPTWDDAAMSAGEYLAFTHDWLDLCIGGLRAGGALWVNIPDDWAAEIVVHLKARGLTMVNWCLWHYRFGQNTTGRFIGSKVHALYFCKGSRGEVAGRTWNPGEVLELSDREAIYADPRTREKRDGLPAGRRVPLDVWYGQYWGRIQGNNKERRRGHDNQLPEVYLERVVRSTSRPGDLVLDPFLGSGTTGVIAHALGRRFIGCEFSPTHARQAAARIEAGPVRLDALRDSSTAIFPHRRKGQRASGRAADAETDSAATSAPPARAVS